MVSTLEFSDGESFSDRVEYFGRNSRFNIVVLHMYFGFYACGKRLPGAGAGRPRYARPNNMELQKGDVNGQVEEGDAKLGPYIKHRLGQNPVVVSHGERQF